MSEAPALRLPAPRPRRMGWVNGIGLWSLYRRELTRFMKDYIDSLLGPVVTNLLFMAVFRLALGDRTWGLAGIALVDFVAPALVMFAIAERALSATSASVLFDKHTGALADILMAPLTPLELTLGYGCAAASAGLVTGLVVALGLAPFAHYSLGNPAALLLFAAAAGLLFAFLGLLVGLWSTRWDHYTTAHSFLFIPPAYFSGMFFPVAGLPGFAQGLVALNPFFYALDGLRGAMTGWHEADALTGAAVLAGCNLAAGALVWRLIAKGYRIKA